MSQVCRSRLALWVWILFVGAYLYEARFQVALAAEAGMSPKQAAVLETYAKPEGETYFALKLSPQVAQPKIQPLDVVVLFDTSASQIGAYRAKALGALRAMLAALSADDRVALVAVDVTAARLTQGFVPPSGGPVAPPLAALDRRVPLGSTDMREALEVALATWSENDAGRARSVMYIGDGFSAANPVPVATLQRIVGQYAEHRVSFSSYAIGPRINGELLGALANHTGGMLVADDNRMSDRQIGDSLATIARGAVLWPTASNFPAAMRDVYPRQTPPLRFDRDSVLVGTFDSQAVMARQPLAIEIGAELGGKQVTLGWKASPEEPIAENAYLAKVVEFARLSNGVALPTVSGESLNEIHRWANFGAQQLAQLGERALAVGRTDEAAQLADEAERLDPTNAEADLVRAAARARQPAAGDLRVARSPAAESRSAADQSEVADGELLASIERQDRIVEGFLRSEVTNALNQSNSTVSADPEATRYQLKLLLDKVQHTAEITPDVRAQMVDQVEAGLRAASRMSTIKTENDLRRQQIEAEGEARERIHRELVVQEQKIDQLMSRFDALMDEQRYRDAEALADIAEGLAPATPGLRGAELTARMTGYTADLNAIRDNRHKGFVDAGIQVELSDVPSPDDPPIIYPDPEVWQLVTERRKKYKAVDLSDPGPSEAKILAALDEKTDIDFTEQPLSDILDYLKERHGIEIQLDKKALTDAGLGSDVPVSRNIKGITLRSALKLLLGELDLTYVLRNEVLMITTKSEAENMLSSRVYPVADLVIPIPAPRNMNGPAAGGMGGGFLGGGMGGSMGGMGGMGMGGMGGMGMGGMGMGGMGGGMGGMGMGGGMGFF